MNRGVIYMTWGPNAVTHADASMASLWAVEPGLPVLVVGDRAAGAHYNGKPAVTFCEIDTEPFRGTEFLAGRIKPRLAKLSPFEQTLYVDADTEFQHSPTLGFDMLARWELVVAETQTRSLLDSIAGRAETNWTAQWAGSPHLLYHNSGMLFWRKCPAVTELFDLWAEEWQRFEGWDEQVALLRALLRSEVVYQTVPYTWNCRVNADSTFLHHRFGTKIAWKYAARRRPWRANGPHARPGKVPDKPAPPVKRVPRRNVPMVTVEVAPGRMIRCRPGEQEAVKARWAQRMRRRA